jgi:predicted cupin superfamily sugar epimerase
MGDGITIRARELIRALKLMPHPEGGFFSEVFRSPRTVKAGQGGRAAITTIYFLLPRGAVSRWHRVASDEIWHFVEGAPLRLHHLAADFSLHRIRRLGPCRGRMQRPIAVIPAGDWQAAETTGDYTLAACDVGPGFDFSDFTMLRDDLPASAELARRRPRWKRLA